MAQFYDGSYARGTCGSEGHERGLRRCRTGRGRRPVRRINVIKNGPFLSPTRTTALLNVDHTAVCQRVTTNVVQTLRLHKHAVVHGSSVRGVFSGAPSCGGHDCKQGRAVLCCAAGRVLRGCRVRGGALCHHYGLCGVPGIRRNDHIFCGHALVSGCFTSLTRRVGPSYCCAPRRIVRGCNVDHGTIIAFTLQRGVPQVGHRRRICCSHTRVSTVGRGRSGLGPSCCACSRVAGRCKLAGVGVDCCIGGCSVAEFGRKDQAVMLHARFSGMCHRRQSNACVPGGHRDGSNRRMPGRPFAVPSNCCSSRRVTIACRVAGGAVYELYHRGSVPGVDRKKFGCCGRLTMGHFFTGCGTTSGVGR